MKRLLVILRQKSSMRKLVATSLMMFVVLLGSAGVSWGADFQKGYAAPLDSNWGQI
jgi:preprotein translocase subunit SecF